MYRSGKSCFAMEPVEQLLRHPVNTRWKTVRMSRKLGLLVLRTASFETGFEFTDNIYSSTVIINYCQNYYCGEVFEFHLTAIKTYDFVGIDVLDEIHLTVRNFSREMKNHSFYYLLQQTSQNEFRFIKCDFLEANQIDNMNEFIGQQGFFNVSSAVLLPVLKVLSDFQRQGKINPINNILYLYSEF